MKSINKLFLVLLTGILFSCENQLDINTDPNSPTEITPGLALSAAQASLITVTGGDFSNLGGFYAQYHTQAPTAGQYETIDQYNMDTSYANRTWTELYAGCINDLEFVITESNKTGDTGGVLIGTALKAYTFQLLVDVFGDVPYTEALQGVNNITPKTTEGSVIYLDLIAKIDAALASYKANPVTTSIGKQDNIYESDMDQWVKFANTLKLKMYLRMAYTSLANPTKVNTLLAENDFLESDAKFSNFGTGLNQRNPFYEVQMIFLGDVNNVASNSLFEFYNINEDPRLESVFRANSAGAYLSISQGSGDTFNNLASNYSRPNIKADTPVYLLTVAESNFLQAEALIRYGGGAGAKAKYEEGVKTSFETYGLSRALATPFLATGGVYEYISGSGIEATVRQVIIQKWASLAYINNMEAYIETTRTKFPEIVTKASANYALGNRIPSEISVLSGNTVPSILYYPDNETERNPNIKQHLNLTQKVWWDKK
ncbi:SusD/RagB family nutrient-binding outer membrane lipoprotein [Flavobacterium eburneipallidum]|uniref:SusD/RagB family nutrient-binding outer membrane lipoprotein n=1 Tax=Flavobacterium eburneipallidum TaxID=3003263 RepID=UPI00248276CC|nr:SusD/RagB family nutrient-binding outer membrane lipoprotein [Flavobacterium eburneipallidum]